jgi:hypothetical protein
MISLSRMSQTMKVKAHAFEKLITSPLENESNIELRISAPNITSKARNVLAVVEISGLPFKSK